MNKTRRRTAISNPWLAWGNLMLTSASMIATSAEVIGLRTRRLANAGVAPAVGDWMEMTLMVQEKVLAAGESSRVLMQQVAMLNSQLLMAGFQQMLRQAPIVWGLAGGLAPAQAHARWMRAAWSGTAAANEKVFRAAPRIASHALKPIHSRASANARRLRRRKAGA
jgi:hypothetical protein